MVKVVLNLAKRVSKISKILRIPNLGLFFSCYCSKKFLAQPPGLTQGLGNITNNYPRSSRVHYPNLNSTLAMVQ